MHAPSHPGAPLLRSWLSQEGSPTRDTELSVKACASPQRTTLTNTRLKPCTAIRLNEDNCCRPPSAKNELLGSDCLIVLIWHLVAAVVVCRANIYHLPVQICRSSQCRCTAEAMHSRGDADAQQRRCSAVHMHSRGDTHPT